MTSLIQGRRVLSIYRENTAVPRKGKGVVVIQSLAQLSKSFLIHHRQLLLEFCYKKYLSTLIHSSQLVASTADSLDHVRTHCFISKTEESQVDLSLSLAHFCCGGRANPEKAFHSELRPSNTLQNKRPECCAHFQLSISPLPTCVSCRGRPIIPEQRPLLFRPGFQCLAVAIVLGSYLVFKSLKQHVCFI